jgi:transcriptional regulator with XRE-family HTH domain
MNLNEENIKELMKRKNFSQVDLAACAKISRQHLSRLMHGANTNSETASRIALCLDAAVGDITGKPIDKNAVIRNYEKLLSEYKSKIELLEKQLNIMTEILSKYIKK